MSYEVTLGNYQSVIGALPANTASTPYDVVITDGENLAPNVLRPVQAAKRYVNLSFTPATVESDSIRNLFRAGSVTLYLVSCDMSNLDLSNVTDAVSMFGNVSLKTVVLPPMENLTTAAEMFSWCDSLESITLPAMPEVTNVGGMFQVCRALKNITLPATMPKVTAAYSMFQGCESLESITLPAMPEVTNVKGMILQCSALKKVDISGLASGTNTENLFRLCPALKEITVATTNYETYVSALDENTAATPYDVIIADDTFDGDVLLNDIFSSMVQSGRFVKISFSGGTFGGFTLCSDYAYPESDYLIECDMSSMACTNLIYVQGFRNCKNLKKVKMPNITSSAPCTANGCFFGCASLTEVEFLPANFDLTQDMFSLCSSLEQVDLSKIQLKDTGRMFQNCTALKDVVLPDLSSVSSAASMFVRCSNLVTVDISTLTAAANVYDLFLGCSSLKTVVLPASMASTNAKGMFYGCSSLEDITLPVMPEVTNANEMFYRCSALKTADVSGIAATADVSNIFQECTVLEEITVTTVNYETIVSALNENTAATPYGIVISDGENLRPSAMKVDETGRYVNLGFRPAVVERQDIESLFDYNSTITHQYLISCDMSNLDMSNVTYAKGAFHSNKGLKTVVMPSLRNVWNSAEMFLGCNALENVTLPDMSKVTDAVSMFYNCRSLEHVDIGTFRKLEDALNMFCSCHSLVEIDATNLTELTDAESMFADCGALENVTLPDMSKITKASYMFQECLSLESIDLSPLENVVNARSMFFKSGITTVNISGMNNLKYAANMFKQCASLESVDISGMENVEDAEEMFAVCEALTHVNISGMGNVTNATGMFFGDQTLESANLTSLVSATNGDGMFSSCVSLEEVSVPPALTNVNGLFMNCPDLTTVKNFKWDFSNMENTTNCFSGCSSLTHLYYYSDNDPALIIPNDDWLLYYKGGASASEGYTLTAYDRKGNVVLSESLGRPQIHPIGQTNSLLFDTQPIDCANIIKSPYLFGINDGKTLDAAGGTLAILAKDTDKIVTNIFESKAIRDMVSNITPAGIIQMYGGTTAPEGWLFCNGEEVPTAQYPRLYAAIGNTYGTPKTTGNFVLPDFRECVPVGAGQSNRSAISTHDVFSLGQYKNDCIQNITGWGTGTPVNSSGGGAFYSDPVDFGGFGGGNYRFKQLLFDASRQVRTSSVTRTKQIGTNYIIKY